MKNEQVNEMIINCNGAMKKIKGNKREHVK